MVTVTHLSALEILDSRGKPTLSVRAVLSSGAYAAAHVPSGASTGRHEACELRDGDPERHNGSGVLKAAGSVEAILLPLLRGMDASNLPAIDREMIQEDGTPAKSRLGANAILGASCAIARALAAHLSKPLWRVLADQFASGPPSIPLPMVNIISGGLHAGGQIDFQDFLVRPLRFESLRDALEATTRVHRATREILESQSHRLTGVADEGGWGPALDSNQSALDLLCEAIERAGFLPGEHFDIALDAAASHFFLDGSYRLASESRSLTSAGIIDLLDDWRQRYPIASIEDALDQDDWAGWTLMTERLGEHVQLVGDDLFTTNPERLRLGIERKAANAVLVKMNQIGTLSETFEVLRLAREHGYKAVVSARSGETEDSFLADLAVASGAGQIKIGSVTRSERLAKYNRLLEIEAFELIRSG